MRLLKEIEINCIQGGKALTNEEATNAYMMAGSMFFPILGTAIFKAAFPAIVESTLLGGLAKAIIVGAGTGFGVWLGYQVYYAIYDDRS